MDAPPLRALIYVRISQDQAGEGAGVARQEEACRQLAASRGWEVVGVEPDKSISASTGKVRPGFERVLARAAAGECDVILAFAIDRVTRTIKDLTRVIDVAVATGVGLVTAQGDIDLTTPVGKMVATILAAVAAQEVEVKAVRQRAANVQNALAGGRTKGIRAFGFEEDKITIRETEADAIRQAARDVLNGASLGAVARSWTAAGFRPALSRAGKPCEWTNGGVRYILRSPRYIGKRVYLGEIVGDAVWPAILDDATFHALQLKLTAPSRLAGPGYKRAGGMKPTTLLASLAVCGKCGGRARANTRPNGTGVYSCRTHHCFSLDRDAADELVAAEVLAWASTPGKPDLIPQDESDGTDAEALRHEVEAIHERKRQIGASIGTGAMNLEVGLAAQEAANNQLAAAEARLANLGRGTALEGLAGAHSPAAWWAGLTLARMREVVDYLMLVELHPQPGRRRGFHDDLVTITPRV